jgi:hypothetical protein
MGRSRVIRPPTHKNRIYLNSRHELVGRLADVGSLNDLICHIVLDHGFESYDKARDAARHHLMLHAQLGVPERGAMGR